MFREDVRVPEGWRAALVNLSLVAACLVTPFIWFTVRSWPADVGLPASFCDDVAPCYLGFNRTVRNVADDVDYTSFFVQDTLTYGNLTANIGFRYQRQNSVVWHIRKRNSLKRRLHWVVWPLRVVWHLQSFVFRGRLTATSREAHSMSGYAYDLETRT